MISFFIIKKRTNLDINTDAFVIDSQESVISGENTPQSIMKKDKLFAAEFN